MNFYLIFYSTIHFFECFQRLRLNRNMKCEKIFTLFFGVLCVFTTFSLCLYWCYQFALNEDLSIVHYTEFYQTNDNIYPTLSLCLKEPFIKERLNEYETNETSYSAFLSGNFFSKELMRINYSYVSIDILDYIKDCQIYLRNATVINMLEDLSQEQQKSLIFNSFNGFISWVDKFYKCFSFVLPQHKDVDTFLMTFSNEIFKTGIYVGDRQIRTHIHLPHHFLISESAQRWAWPEQSKSSRYRATVSIQSMDIVINRNTKTHECNDNWKNYDDWAIKKHISEIGCSIPYLEAGEKHNMCSNGKLISEAKLYHDFVAKKKYIMPCKTMQNIHFNWEEYNIEDAEDRSSGDFMVGIHFPTRIFKEIIQTR